MTIRSDGDYDKSKRLARRDEETRQSNVRRLDPSSALPPELFQRIIELLPPESQQISTQVSREWNVHSITEARVRQVTRVREYVAAISAGLKDPSFNGKYDQLADSLHDRIETRILEEQTNLNLVRSSNQTYVKRLVDPLLQIGSNDWPLLASKIKAAIPDDEIPLGFENFPTLVSSIKQLHEDISIVANKEFVSKFLALAPHHLPYTLALVSHYARGNKEEVIEDFSRAMINALGVKGFIDHVQTIAQREEFEQVIEAGISELCTTDHPQSAIALTQMLSDTDIRSKCLSEIVYALCWGTENGHDVDAAIQLAQTIPNPRDRIGALTDIYSALIANNRSDETIQMVRDLMLDTLEKASAITSSIEMLCSFNTDLALDLARNISDPGKRSSALRRLCRELLLREEEDKALVIARGIMDPGEDKSAVFDMMANQLLTESAESTDASYSQEYACLLLLEGNKLDRVLEVASQIQYTAIRDRVWRQLAIKYIQNGNIEAAIGIIKTRVENKIPAIEVVCFEIAKRGQLEQACATYRDLVGYDPPEKLYQEFATVSSRA